MEASTLHDSSNETCCNIDDFVLVLPSPPLTETRRGVLRFVGLTDFAEGVWAGVEVVGVFGRNDGSVRGRKYFSCVPGQGLFVRPSQVQPYTAQHVDASPSPAPPPTAAVVAAPTVKEEELIAAREAAAAEAEVARRLRAELAEVRQHASAAEASLTTLQKELNAKQASQGAEDASVKERMRLEAELANMRTNAAEMHTKHEAEQAQAAREKELLLAEVHVLKEKAAATSEPTLPAEPLSSTEELARMTKERDDLHMMCGLLEEELSQQKKQADEFAQLLQAAAEERAKEHPGWAPNDAHEQQQQQQHDVATTSNANELRSLKMELDTANLTIFQLTKEKEATSELRRSYEELSNAAERQKVVQREREEKIVLEYEEALQHLRRLKDAAQRECAMAREEAARKMEASNTATRRPDFVLSTSEREMYEEKLLAQQRLLLRTIQPLQLMPCCCMPGAQDVGASPQPLEAVVRAKVADLRHALETTSIARVLDFSSPTACASSTRKLFGVEHTSTAA